MNNIAFRPDLFKRECFHSQHQSLTLHSHFGSSALAYLDITNILQRLASFAEQRHRRLTQAPSAAMDGSQGFELANRPGPSDPKFNEYDQWFSGIFGADQGQAQQSQGKYDVERARGRMPNDVTAFLESQRHWSIQNLPDILFQYNKLDHRNPDYEPENRIDPKTGLEQRDPRTGRVLRKFRNIPETLSSKVEGWLLEAIMREDDRITLKDIFAYIPEGPEKPKDEHALQMRTKRFREEYRLRSWCSRAGSSWWEEQIEQEMTPEQKAQNTTRGLRRFTSAELRAIRLKRRGTCPQRAGTRGRIRRTREEFEQDGSEGIPEPDSKRRRIGSDTRQECADEQLPVCPMGNFPPNVGLTFRQMQAGLPTFPPLFGDDGLSDWTMAANPPGTNGATDPAPSHEWTMPGDGLQTIQPSATQLDGQQGWQPAQSGPSAIGLGPMTPSPWQPDPYYAPLSDFDFGFDGGNLDTSLHFSNGLPSMEPQFYMPDFPLPDLGLYDFVEEAEPQAENEVQPGQNS